MVRLKALGGNVSNEKCHDIFESWGVERVNESVSEQAGKILCKPASIVAALTALVPALAAPPPKQGKGLTSKARRGWVEEAAEKQRCS